MNDASGSDRRRFHRVSFDGVAHLECEAREQQVALLDISLHGVMVEVADGGLVPRLDQCCGLRVPLAPDLEIHLWTRVVREHGGTLGLAVERMDLESAQHLRRLVELNLGDDSLLQRDLEALFEG